MENSMTIILAILTVGFITHGVIYGLQILHTPTEPGWTWSSVATGTLCILIAQGFYCAILQLFDSFAFLNVIVALIGGFVVYAVPMALTQIYKRWSAHRLSQKIKKNRDFNHP